MNQAQLLTLRQLLERHTQPDGLSRLDAEVLLCHLLQRPRSHLYTWPEQTLDETQCQQFGRLVQRRLADEPVAYITGQREFWSLTLRVTPDTLIPRPETETLVERALSHLQHLSKARVADLGTGSGAIAAAVASERPDARIIATDISPKALSVARQNFKTLGLDRIETRQGAWMDALPPEALFDLIISNPPYVAESDPHLQQNGLHLEPRIALISGHDGLDDIRHLIRSATGHLKAGGWLLLEHGVTQGEGVRNYLSSAGYRAINTLQDLEGRERASEGQFPG